LQLLPNSVILSQTKSYPVRNGTSNQCRSKFDRIDVDLTSIWCTISHWVLLR